MKRTFAGKDQHVRSRDKRQQGIPLRLLLTSVCFRSRTMLRLLRLGFGIGHDANLAEHETEPGLLRRDADVHCQCHRRAHTHGGAIDRGDHRLCALKYLQRINLWGQVFHYKTTTTNFLTTGQFIYC